MEEEGEEFVEQASLSRLLFEQAMRGKRYSSHLLVASAVYFSSKQQQTATIKAGHYNSVCIPLLRHISFSLLLSHSQAVSVLTTDRRI